MKGLSSRITSDLFLVLTSLAIAFVIWMIAKRDEMGQDLLNVRVQLSNVAANVEAHLPGNLRSVQVTVTFPKSLRAHIRDENLVMMVDWHDLPEPRTWCGVEDFAQSPPLALRPNNVRPAVGLPDDVRSWIDRQMQCTAIEPSKIIVEGRFITREARIVLRTEGEVAQGHRLVGITSSVGATALLTAPRGRFEELERQSEGRPIEIPTEAIDLTGHTDSFPETVRLQLPAQTELVDLDRRIDANVTIEPIYAVRAVSGVRIAIESPNENLTVSYSPALATVTVHGPQRLVDEVAPSDLVVRAAQRSLAQPGIEVTVTLKADFVDTVSRETADAVSIRSVTPEALVVRYDMREAARAPDEPPSHMENTNRPPGSESALEP